MSKLKDILLIIFEELEDDQRSLFSCLLVNKLWCESAVIFLWRNPWRYYLGFCQEKFLYNTILLFLSDETKEFLKLKGIEIPPSSQNPPLFDYLSFCRHLNVVKINSIIHLSDYKKYIVEQEVYKLLMRKCSPLKSMDIRYIKHHLDCFNGAESCLSRLSELKCTTYDQPLFYDRLAQHCQYIEKLTIDQCRKDNYGLAKLIQVQKNLKYIEFNGTLFVGGEEEYDPFGDVGKALIGNVDSLVHFKAFFCGNISFPPSVLPKLYNLQKLQFFIPRLDKKYEDQLRISSYPNLRILHVENISPDTVAEIIEKTGGNLRKLLIEKYRYCKDSKRLIHSIYNNCPNIENLSIIIHNYNFMEFKKLLKICQNLKELYIGILNNDEFEEKSEEEKFEDGEILSEILIDSAAKFLNYLKLSYWKISSNNFEKFLKNWRGRPPLTLINANYDDVFDSELLKKYKNEGVIKRFDIEPSYYFLD
ncbi:hypothetical protein RclHR1_14800003 [Rhizophagus clarus]|uniref:F-box domain-containing protein n=1 Tax=Rhizophagus clarus TaxID=94130 RepID=A0A2Z6R6D7_9GLOM|nr:hypothetical protein RclHR1_14800003 [Rhizophagus clarus]GES74460.1 hypothetical protein GLOIN_2v1764020 [Rhizophagus clarus]